MKPWLGDTREVRSLETKLAGKTPLQREDVEHLISLFLERWVYDAEVKEDQPYLAEEKDRGILTAKLTADVMAEAGASLRLPLRTRGNGDALRTPTAAPARQTARVVDDGSEPSRERLIDYYRDNDALIVVSREQTFIGSDPASTMLGFQSLMDDLRAVDEGDEERFRSLIWIVDLGRRETDASAQNAFHNFETVATQFRSFLDD